MRFTEAAKVTLERAAVLAGERGQREVRAGHVLLAMMLSPDGVRSLCQAAFSLRRLLVEVEGALGAGGSPYRSAEPVVASSDGLLRELASAVRFGKRFRLLETTADDLLGYALRAPELARPVAASRFDTSVVDDFSRGAALIAGKFRSPVVRLEFALMHALERDEVRAPLLRAGFDLDAIAKKLTSNVEWNHTSDALAARAQLREFAVLKANAGGASALSLVPVLADLLPRRALRGPLAAAGTDGHALLLGLVHGARVHADPPGALRPAIVVHDDPVSTMEHVVEVLEAELALPKADAVAVMRAVDKSGSAEVEVGDRDPRALVEAIRARSKAAGMPLRVELVPQG